MIATQKDHSIASRVREKFKTLFSGSDPLIVRSPGRVNLIGEHTDYNNGFVLPAAINKAIYMAVSRRSDDELHLVSLDLDRQYTGSVKGIKPSSLHWPDYILGVIQQIQALGHPVGGFNCVFGGDISLGAGMSFSAALEFATALAVNQLFWLWTEPMTLVNQRCGYVVEEITRLLAATQDLEKGDITAFGQKMFATHEGPSHKYEVSCAELDYLVKQVQNDPGVIGARMMRGGFGGCTINLVKEDAIDELVKRLTPLYRKAMNKELKVYIGQIENGTSTLIDSFEE